MNPLDRVIAAIWPQIGLRRAAARAALSVISIQNRYEAARRDRALEGWLTTSASANAEIGSQVEILRGRARDLGRNNPFLCRAYDLLAAEMVGKGVRPRLAEHVPPQIRTRTMDLWNQWANDADVEGLRDLYGLQLLAARTVVESGEALIRFYPTDDGARIPWKIRVLEPDWIDQSQHRALPDGRQVIQGVEYSRTGKRLGYYMFTDHPGSGNLFSTTAPRVEFVSADRIAAVFYSMRPEQTHGVPWCVPCVTTAQNLDDLNDARMKRAKVQACFSAFIYKNPDSSYITTEPETGRRRQELSPGMIEYLLPDEQISFGQPPAGEGDDQWQIMLMHAIAAGVGLTYSQLTGDLRQVNYSSMRSGMLNFWKLLDTWQTHMLRPMMCIPMWRKFDLFAAAATSRREYPLEVEWDFPERPFIDPSKDGEAIDAALLSGRRTFHEIISATGRDPEAHIAELRRERTELGDLNLPHILPDAPQQVPAAAKPSNGKSTLDNGNGEDAMPLQ